MSDQTVKEIIERALNDKAFRQLLFKNPDEALKEYDLTDEERKILEGLDEDNFDDFAGGLGDRSTKGAIRPSF
ncbi:MAG: Franean1_4349 family RiPP [Candidatus Promineifilaceae bacterium]